MTDISFNIREVRTEDTDAIWNILEPIFREGETYPVDPDVSRTDGLAYWFAKKKRNYVCIANHEIVGTYYMCPNSTGPANHICNCGYAVHPSARGMGVASAMCLHSFEEAGRQGYRGMQYNLVVTTNHAAVHLWQKMGMAIIGTAPNVFRRPDNSYAAAHIMFKDLTVLE